MDMKRMMGGALRNAPMAPGARPMDQQPMPRQQGPFEMGGVGQMGAGMPDQPERKGMGVGDIMSEFVLNYGAASGNPLASGILERRLAQQQAAAQQQAQERMYERKRGDERADKQWEWQNKPKVPYRWESNDGSLMEIGPDDQPRVAYKDPTAKMNYQRVNKPDGTFTMVPIPVGGAAPQMPTAPVGKLTPIDGGTATMANTPAPQLGANGIPATMTQQQYNAVVAAKGKAWTDNMVTTNRIQVTR